MAAVADGPQDLVAARLKARLTPESDLNNEEWAVVLKFRKARRAAVEARDQGQPIAFYLSCRLDYCGAFGEVKSRIQDGEWSA